MRVFGCAWKINFSEIIFSWPGVLKALTRKWFEVKTFTSNHFQTHAQRERERERGRERERESLWLRRSEPSTSTLPIYEPTDLWTDHAFDFADLRTDLRTHEPIFDPKPSTHEPSTSPATQSLRAMNRSSTQSLRPTNLQLCRWPKAFAPRPDLWPRAFDPKPWTHKLISLSVWFWSTHKPTSLWSLIFLLLLWWCGWWWKIAFSECYQTYENIF